MPLLPFQCRDPTSPDILRHGPRGFGFKPQAIPRNFGAMFRFNAAVMGVSRQDWMYEAGVMWKTVKQNVKQVLFKEFSGGDAR